MRLSTWKFSFGRFSSLRHAAPSNPGTIDVRNRNSTFDRNPRIRPFISPTGVEILSRGQQSSIFSIRLLRKKDWSKLTRPSDWTVELARPVGATVPEVVQISYSNDMDHLTVLRDKIGRLREEIANIQILNEQFRRDGWHGADAQVAHGQRNERLQAIQLELVRLADLGRKVVSTEQMREKHRSRLHLVKQKRAS
jgi:hypothetical protein